MPSSASGPMAGNTEMPSIAGGKGEDRTTGPSPTKGLLEGGEDCSSTAEGEFCQLVQTRGFSDETALARIASIITKAVSTRLEWEQQEVVQRLG